MKTSATFTAAGYSRSVIIALPAALATIALVLTVGTSLNSTLYGIAVFLGSWGNDLFLLSTNFLIIAWAWRRHRRDLIALILELDVIVWLTVQGSKLISAGNEWALRPNGHPGGFPSGHATHSFAMAFLLTMLFPRLAWLWYSIAAGISWARVESYDHSGLQVAAGVLLGVTIGWSLVGNWLNRRREAKTQPGGRLKASAVKQVS